MKAWGYCRVSTVEQTNGTSLESQKERIGAIAKLHGYNLGGLILEEGVSGKVPLDQRRGGKKLLKLVQKGEVIIASKMDRLFRSLSDAVTMAKIWQDNGILFILGDISSDPLDNGIGRLFFNIMGAIAEFERERIVERTKEGRAQRRRNSQYLGGKVPIGKRLEERDSLKFVVNEGPLDYHKEIIELHAMGMSINSIRDEIEMNHDVCLARSTISRYIKKEYATG